VGRLTWNYRVIRHKTSAGDVFAVHEVYYDAGGRIEYITADPTHPEGETLAELKDKPVLDYDDVVKQIESGGRV